MLLPWEQQISLRLDFHRPVEATRGPLAGEALVKNFADAAFEPEVIELMTTALERAVASLPEPVTTSHVSLLAESILRTAQSGERDVAVLERIALMELQMTPRT
jgi:hypothetical protein